MAFDLAEPQNNRPEYGAGVATGLSGLQRIPPMPRYVAFLRAINVGGHTVKMDLLRELFGELRFSGVETFIASGNVVFSTTSLATEALESRIESRLARALGYDVATFVRLASALPAIGAVRPFAASGTTPEGCSLWVGFLKAAPAADARRRFEALSSDLDELRIDGREAYWSSRTKMSESAVSSARLEKMLGSPVTFRNVTTVMKLAATYAVA